MKTTLDIPDELMRAVKVRAIQNNQKLKETVAELFQRGLSYPVPTKRPHRVQLPFVICQSAHPDQEMTPERVSAILQEQEARDALR